MPNFTAGTSFGANDTVTNTKLNNLIADATINPECSFSINSGTIGTLGCTMGTVATLNSTTGTVATLNSTTGTITTGVIPTLTSITKITSGTGTAAAPAISPTGDTNTGIFFPAADTVAFSEGGVESMRIDSSGNVGIGTTSPTKKLHVVGPAANGAGNEAILIDANAVQLAVRRESGGAGTIEVGTPNNHNLAFFTNGTVGVSFNSGGNVGIGTASPATKLHVDGTIRYTNRPAAGTITALGFDANGDLKASSSSLRYKHDVQDYEKGLSDLMQLRPVSFKFNGETRKNSGFIAEEVSQLGLDEVMLYDGENRPDGIIYTNMISLLTKSLQELKLENDSLRTRIEALESK